MVVGVGTGLAALYQTAPASVCPPCISEGRSKCRSLAPRGEPAGASAGGQGAIYEDVLGAYPVEQELGREDLSVRVRFRALADGGSRIVHPHLATNGAFGNRAQCVRGG